MSNDKIKKYGYIGLGIATFSLLSIALYKKFKKTNVVELREKVLTAVKLYRKYLFPLLFELQLSYQNIPEDFEYIINSQQYQTQLEEILSRACNEADIDKDEYLESFETVFKDDEIIQATMKQIDSDFQLATQGKEFKKVAILSKQYPYQLVFKAFTKLKLVQYCKWQQEVQAAYMEGRRLSVGDLVLVNLSKPTKMELQEEILVDLGFEDEDEDLHPYHIFQACVGIITRSDEKLSKKFKKLSAYIDGLSKIAVDPRSDDLIVSEIEQKAQDIIDEEED